MCGTVCCAGIDTVELWEANRANLVKRGFGPYGKQSLFPKLIGDGQQSIYEATKRPSCLDHA